MARTAEMFPKIWTPRKVRMHFEDLGNGHDGARIGTFRCRACGHLTGWIVCSREDERRGIPCPKCNADQPT